MRWKITEWHSVINWYNRYLRRQNKHVWPEHKEWNKETSLSNFGKLVSRETLYQEEVINSVQFVSTKKQVCQLLDIKSFKYFVKNITFAWWG